MRQLSRIVFGFLILAAAPMACGDVGSDLITLADGGSDCHDDSACPPQTPRCDLDSQRCLECLLPSDCTAEQVCALPAGTCVARCTEDSDCPSTTPVCDGLTGLCQGCTNDDECPESTPRCKPDTGRCVECTVTTVAIDCPPIDDALVCDGAGRCVECTDDLFCSDGEACNTFLGECGTRCAGPGVCSGDEPICNLTMEFCVECQAAADCGGDSCVRSECVDGP